MDQRVAWSTAGGVVLTTSATNAVGWAIAAAAPGSHLSLVPVYVFSVMALLGLYMTFAGLLGFWPLNRLGVSPADLLDDCIRAGIDARARIVYKELDDYGAATAAAAWFLDTANRLDKEFPAVSDEFRLAAGDETVYSGQALIISTLAMKIKVLSDARKRISS